MTTVASFIDDDYLTDDIINLTLSDQGNDLEEQKEKGVESDGVCAICLDNIELQETALIKGCEHTYCVNCILRWTTYHEHPKCPQCKHPFESLGVYRSLDGTLHDYMLEESVCLLVRAIWFKPLVVEHPNNKYDEHEDLYHYQYEYQYVYEEEDEDLDEVYFRNSSSVRIGNRRWGDSGYVRSGRQEAKPVHRSSLNDSSAGSSCQGKKKEVECHSDANSSHGPKKREVGKELMGRRAKRALKRESADKAATAKHQEHLVKLGRQD